MMLYLKTWVLFFMGAIFFIAPLVNAQDVVIIASPDVPVESISASELQSIFLGKKTTWKNGSKIIFFTLKDGDIHTVFLKNYVEKTASQYKNFWQHLVFSGKAKMPESVDNERQMVARISDATNAIGYVSTGVKLDKTKKILVK